MSLISLQLQPISISHYYLSGDVTIQEGVAIAPGVLIQADPNSCVIIKTGACIGIGAILHASNGVLEIGEGANIGAEVLLVGQVSIGRNACIGAASTILNSSVASGILIPSGSVVGDLSRPPDELQATETVFYPPAESAPSTEPSSPKPDPTQSPQSTLVNNSDPSAQSLNVYGQVYVNQLLVKMFPHHPINQPSTSSTHLSSTDDPWED
ncbi:MAG: carbon dioxide concentrating mechanism protein [Leptolyngbya sp.]|nr:MAG: carbon dioxide concentrating mechanism protein [Leptolyngbya sp.]